MTGLPKELINHAQRTSPSAEHKSVEQRRPSRFKELMNKQLCQEKEHRNSLFSLIEEEQQPKEEETDLASTLVAPIAPIFSADAHLTSTTAISSVLATQDIQTLFEEMATAMIVMDTTQDRETTLFLDSAKFSASGLGGTRITIKEFSTSPKAFNIEIATCHAVALHLIEAHKSALIAVFEEGKFPFSVHRLDTQLQTERHSHQEDSQDPNEDQS